MYLRLSTTKVCVGRLIQSTQFFGLFGRQLRPTVAGCSALPPCSSPALRSQSRKFIKPACSRPLIQPRTAAFSQHVQTGLRSPAATKHACHAAVRHTASCYAAAVRDAAPQTTGPKTLQQRQLTMDYTALVASVAELKTNWIPAKVEQVGDSTVLY